MNSTTSRARTLVHGGVLCLMVALAGCRGDAAAPDTVATIDRETFIATYVDLRTTTIRAEAHVLSDDARTTILARHGVSEEDLMRFAETRGEDIGFMREVWDEVEARMDAVRVLPSTDERH